MNGSVIVDVIKGDRLFLRILLAVFFLTAAIAKIAAFTGFLFDLEKITLLPRGIVIFVGMVVIGAEIGGGIGLLIGVHRRIVCTLLIALVLIFICVDLQAVLTDQQIECGCFGNLMSEEMGWRSVIRNAVVCLLLLRTGFRSKGTTVYDRF